MEQIMDTLYRLYHWKKLQCLCYYGFCTKKDYLILFMTGGKISVVLMIRGSWINRSSKLARDATIFMITDTACRNSTTLSMFLNIGKEAATMDTSISILRGTLIISIIIIIFIVFRKTYTSMGHNKIMQHVDDDIGPHKHPEGARHFQRG